MDNPTKQLDDVSMGAPHVVLLGAGASLAAFPEGDRHGKKVPVMKDLIEIAGLDKILEEYGVDYSDTNFEYLYSSLVSKKGMERVAHDLERKIHDYFSTLMLPDEPTIYDYLVLSMREKDVIATFNWDPFLQQALRRNNGVVPIPRHIFYLHGNVAMGYCMECKKTKGPMNSNCTKCKSSYTHAKLLYPVDQKNYQQEPVDMEWAALRYYLKEAYVFTIFGYSAPKTDVEAIELLKEAWGGYETRKMEEMEIIHRPGKEREVARALWDDFIHTHHYQATGDYLESILGRHPRRSCEAIWNAVMMCDPPLENSPPEGVSLVELQDWFRELAKHE